jgi:hypothetical protein
MNATSPICNSLVSSLVKPSVVLQRSISADRIARRNNRNAQFKAAVLSFFAAIRPERFRRNQAANAE